MSRYNSLFIANADTKERVDTAKDYKEEIDIKEDINILIVSPKGTLLMTKNIKEMEKEIKKSEEEAKYIYSRQLKGEKISKKSAVQIKSEKIMTDIFKLEKMVFMFYIEKKSITAMEELLKSKYNKLYSELFETSEELVEVGAIDEGDHLKNASSTKKFYERSMKHIDLYTSATFVLITNKTIDVE